MKSLIKKVTKFTGIRQVDDIVTVSLHDALRHFVEATATIELSRGKISFVSRQSTWFVSSRQDEVTLQFTEAGKRDREAIIDLLLTLELFQNVEPFSFKELIGRHVLALQPTITLDVHINKPAKIHQPPRR